MDEGSEGAGSGVLLNNPALAAAAESEEARVLLRRQARLVELQIADLEREDAVRHWSLRIRHVSDVLKLGFELAAASLVTIAVIFVLGSVWSAAHDDGLVIEAFNVPADMAQKGLSGQVVATQVQDRLTWMQANTDTIRQGDSYRSAFGDDIKVQIPDTGISIGEFYRYLAGWLGHQKHITGEIWHGPGGAVSLSVRSGAESASVFTGNETDLPALIGKAAERIYWQTQPYRYSVFLEEQGRRAESRDVSRKLAQSGAPDDEAWAYSRLGLTAMIDGDFRAARDFQRKAIAANPNLPHIWDNLGAADNYFGHDEAVLRDMRRSRAVLADPQATSQLASYAVDAERLTVPLIIDDALGDYRGATAIESQLHTKPNYSGSVSFSLDVLHDDLILDHDLAAALSSADGDRATEALAVRNFATGLDAAFTPPLPAYDLAVARGDWPAARDDLQRVLAGPDAKLPLLSSMAPVFIRPKLALAEAMTGDFAGADSLIARTPLDCYLCLRVRARIAAARGDTQGAARWFAEAVRQAPSIPFAYSEWGAMLLGRGDADGAIAKFTTAHEKGPRFADPLELWGEALIARNRSDLALAKFAEAAQYAPNWGRLHLKWGEALLWSGDKAEAAKQFALARALYLGAIEKSELARIAVPN